MPETRLFERIYAVVRQIPEGKVATYGQIARIVGGISAQMVGFALAALPNHSSEDKVPWQRVINAKGRISPHGFGFGSAVQRQLLEEEGVRFNSADEVDFTTFGW